VAHICNPIYSGCRGIRSITVPGQPREIVRPYQKTLSQKIGLVEWLKAQHHQKKKGLRKCEKYAFWVILLINE
jgi:hypothetical protein